MNNQKLEKMLNKINSIYRLYLRHCERRVYQKRLWSMNKKPRMRCVHPRDMHLRRKETMTTLRYQPERNKSYLSYVKGKTSQRRSLGSLSQLLKRQAHIRRIVDNMGRSPFSVTTPLSNGSNKKVEKPFFKGRLSTLINNRYLTKVSMNKMKPRDHSYQFNTFLKDFDSVHGKTTHEPKFLVITSSQIYTYPTILPLAMTYGLQLYEPHYVFTTYLTQNKTPIWFFKKKKVYRYSTQSFSMDTKLYENILRSRVKDQSKLFRGYVMSGLGHVFNHSVDRGYTLLRSILSNYHQPDFIIHVKIPEELVFQKYIAFDPSVNYTVLLYNYTDYIRDNIAPKYYQGRILNDDYVPPVRETPFCFSIENGVIQYVNLLEWKDVQPKVTWLYNRKIPTHIDEDWTEYSTLGGIAPDLIQLYKENEYNPKFDLINYVYERFYIAFFARTYRIITFDMEQQRVEMKEIQEWTGIKPLIPHFYPMIKARSWAESKRDVMRGKKEERMECFLQIPWGDGDPKFGSSSYYGVRQGYYKKHIKSPLPSLTQLKTYADTGIRTIEDKLNTNEIEGRILYFRNVKKLPPHLPPLWKFDMRSWSKIDPVTTMEQAVLIRGHYAYRFRYDEALIYTVNKYAVYKFLSDPLYRQLQWAWWTKVHLLVAGQPFCGAKYVGTVLAMVFKAPHIYYDPIYKAALAIKRTHSHAYFLDSCWMVIWLYKWNIYTGHEARRFKYFLPWAISRVREVREMVWKGMDEPTVNEEQRFRCYYPYYRLSQADRLGIFPRLKFEFPDLEPKFCRWENGVLEGYVRVLDLIMLSVLNIDCPPLFLVRLIFESPKHLLPDRFKIEQPREMFLSANILQEFFFRNQELPTPLEEVNLVNQAIYQAMAKCGNLKGEGWVVSGIKVYADFVKKLSSAGVKEKIIYITDPTFHIFHLVHADDTFSQTAMLARKTSFFTRYIEPTTFKKCRKHMFEKLKAQTRLFPHFKCPKEQYCRSPVKAYGGDEPPYKCKCQDYVLAHKFIDACRNGQLPHSMTDKILSSNEQYSPIWTMLKNVAFFNGKYITCSYDHRNLNYKDHLPFRFIPVKPINWRRTYYRRYAFDYFYRKALPGVYSPGIHVEMEKRMVWPGKFTEMVTETTADNIVLEEYCNCRLLCLCKPITPLECARFSAVPRR